MLYSWLNALSIQNKKNRIGQKPLLYIMDEIHSKDIDWEEDFKIAEIMYKTLL